jgi:predicted HicB family RNase H-like nuclease
MAVKKVVRRTRATNQVKKLLEQSYSRVLVPDGGEHYTAEILEFPGCSATGATPAGAYANLERAAEVWLTRWLNDGKEAPRPFTSKETSGRFALRLPKSLYVRASQAAARESVSLNLYIANAVAERVGASAAMQAFDGVVNELSKLAPRGAESGATRRAGAQSAQSAHSARHRGERMAAAARV